MALASMATAPLPSSTTTHKNPASRPFFNPLPLKLTNTRRVSYAENSAKLQVQASLKEKMATGLTAAALTASMVMPDVAEAAEYSSSPSLQNFLFSIAAGGFVLVAILGAVVGVSNFDPVKRA